MNSSMRAVFFDVDFTLIYPGPAFQGEGYRAFCMRHRMDVEPSRFPAAVISASHILDREQDAVYKPQIFVEAALKLAGAGDAMMVGSLTELTELTELL